MRGAFRAGRSGQSADIIRERLAQLRATLRSGGAPNRSRSGGGGMKDTEVDRPTRPDRPSRTTTADLDVAETVTAGQRKSRMKYAMVLAGAVVGGAAAWFLLA